MNRRPAPGAVSIVIAPSWASTMDLAIASPRPDPRGGSDDEVSGWASLALCCCRTPTRTREAPAVLWHAPAPRGVYGVVVKNDEERVWLPDSSMARTSHS